MANTVTILGIYACDLTFLAGRLPQIGETLIGSGFRMGPGGKGSNQVIAARRAGAEVNFIAKIGKDAFGAQARQMYSDEGVITDYLFETADHPTGTAFIYVNDQSADNAIIVVPGAAGQINNGEIDKAETSIAASAVFMCQLETPLAVTAHALALARKHSVTIIFNPAPAAELNDDIYLNVDYFTPNESEASALAGQSVTTIEQAQAAADVFLAKGVKAVIITLGEQGVLVKSTQICQHIPAFPVTSVVDTTGAGDAFNGGFAAALAEGQDLLDAVRFGCATAAISVTQPGCAPSMPSRQQIEALLKA